MTHLEGDGPNAEVRTNESTRTSEHPDSSILGNQEELDKLNEIATNYAEIGEFIIERLQMSTYILSLKLQIPLIMIPNQSPWQSARSAQIGKNGKKQ